MDEENEQNELESDALVKAIKHCLSGKIGVRPTAREYNLHHATLQRHVNNVMVAFEDVSTVADSVLMDFVRKKRMKLPTNMVNMNDSIACNVINRDAVNLYILSRLS